MVDFTFSNVPNTPSGPKFTIKAYSTQLKYLKVAVVITTIPDMSGYPISTANGGTNGAPFVYSGVYMGYTFFNNPKPLVQPVAAQNFLARGALAN